MSLPLVKQANQGKEFPVMDYQQAVQCAVFKGITPAQLNAGFTCIAAGHTRQIRILGFLLVVNAAAVGAATDIRLQSTDGTPVVVATVVLADLTSGSKHGAVSATAALGAGFAAKGNSGQGLKLVKTGATATGAFNLDLVLLYDVV